MEKLDPNKTLQNIHINCDMGESYGRYELVDDAVLMPYIDACNIACGFHAGDPLVIDRTIQLAINDGVQIGAHPGYPDRQGFGRRTMDISPYELESMIRYQVSAILGMTNAAKGHLTHVKAHGALYNNAAEDRNIALAVAKAILSVSSELIIFAPYASIQSEVAQNIGLKVFHEAFIDRTYNPDGSLVSRSKEGAVISDPLQAANQITSISDSDYVIAIDGNKVNIKADTYCIHGDNPSAHSILKYLRDET